MPPGVNGSESVYFVFVGVKINLASLYAFDTPGVRKRTTRAVKYSTEFGIFKLA